MSDPLADVRHYAAGYLAGLRAAELDEAMSYRREAIAIVALRELGVSTPAVKLILEQARHDARMTSPDLTGAAARLLGAEMIITILRRRLLAEAREMEAAA